MVHFLGETVPVKSSGFFLTYFMSSLECSSTPAMEKLDRLRLWKRMRVKMKYTDVDIFWLRRAISINYTDTNFPQAIFRCLKRMYQVKFIQYLSTQVSITKGGREGGRGMLKLSNDQACWHSHVWCNLFKITPHLFVDIYPIWWNSTQSVITLWLPVSVCILKYLYCRGWNGKKTMEFLPTFSSPSQCVSYCFNCDVHFWCQVWRTAL